MKKSYFVRHGLTEANINGVLSGHHETQLTKEGRQQAIATGKALKAKHESIDLIISSPQSRAMETAYLIARELGYPTDKIENNSIFMERTFGILEGTPAEAFLDTNSYQDFETVEGAESIESLQHRAEKAFAHIQSQPAHNILLVGHGAFGRALRRVVNDEPYTHEYAGLSQQIGNAEIVELV